MANAQFDYYGLILMLIVVFFIIMSIVMRGLNPQKYSIKSPQATIRSAILPLLFAIVFNSAKENRWDIGYILSFICLKKVSHGNYLRLILAISYIALILGGLQLIYNRKLNLQNKTKDDHGSK